MIARRGAVDDAGQRGRAALHQRAALGLVLAVLFGVLAGFSTQPKQGAVPFTLYTHCGVNELRVDGRYFERVGGPLDDGSGNPPASWGNPLQEGMLTVTGDTAVFSDEKGHSERFVVRPGATDWLRICA